MKRAGQPRRLRWGRRRSAQRGVALLVVLWACTLLAILVGGYAMLARTEGLQARYQFAQTQAYYAAEAGLARAIQALQDPLASQRWVPDGRHYTMQYDHATVTIAAIDEGGKVDLNSATPQVLQGFFQAAGMDDAAAAELVKQVLLWRTSSEGRSDIGSAAGAYKAAGRDYGPRGGPFASIEELQMVLGMTPAIYQTIAAQITVWSGRESPDPATAPPLALAAIPGMDPHKLDDVYATRQKNRDDGELVSAVGITQSIRSEAALADGTRAVLRATVRLRGAGSGGQPYAVLRWQEGDGE